MSETAQPELDKKAKPVEEKQNQYDIESQNQ